MPMVTSFPVRAAATASATASLNASPPAMTWSAANDPTTASGSRRARIAAASPIAAMESRGDGSTTRLAADRPGQLPGDGRRRARRR